MPRFVRGFVRTVESVNRFVGRIAMYLFFGMGAILLWSTISRLLLGAPMNWALETSQFMLASYYLLGGAYSMQLGAHVRMDLFYDRLEAKRRAQTDAITIVFVIFYLVVLLAGGVSSTNYAITYGQTNYTAWAPLLWPVKTVMTAGIFLMLLQAISNFLKDLAIARGAPIA